MKLRTLSGLWLLLALGVAQADDIELNPAHPERYTVVPGDTLWDIAGRFLAKPWQWPEIWQENRQIANPHWIYPGDELVLRVVNGKPRLQVERRGGYAEPGFLGQRPDEAKLSPTIRVLPLGQPIPAIPLNIIQPFLTEPKVVDADTLQQAPYVVAMANDHVVTGTGDQVYVRGFLGQPTMGLGYQLFRPGKPYRDAESGEIIGYEALYVGNADLQASGDPSTFVISKSQRDVNAGDRIQPVEFDKVQINFQPHPPARPVQGHIISVLDGVSQIGQWNVVVIDRGAVDGLETGHVLDIRQAARLERDMVSPLANDQFTLPPEKEGVMMVFRAYPRISFGLILNANRAIHLYDAVTNP